MIDGPIIALGRHGPARLQDCVSGRSALHKGCQSPIGLSWLACGLTDGSVRIVEVVQKVVPAENPTGFGPEFTVDATFKEAESISVDKRGLTGLRWISVPDKMVGP